jgi:hypothetical protein
MQQQRQSHSAIMHLDSPYQLCQHYFCSIFLCLGFSRAFIVIDV